MRREYHRFVTSKLAKTIEQVYLTWSINEASTHREVTCAPFSATGSRAALGSSNRSSPTVESAVTRERMNVRELRIAAVRHQHRVIQVKIRDTHTARRCISPPLNSKPNDLFMPAACCTAQTSNGFPDHVKFPSFGPLYIWDRACFRYVSNPSGSFLITASAPPSRAASRMSPSSFALDGFPSAILSRI